jgi:hypothetical protein
MSLRIMVDVIRLFECRRSLLVALVSDSVLACSSWSPSGVEGQGIAVFVFNLIDVAKALVQFEHSSKASLEATVQLVHVTVAEEAFLVRCLRWLVC